MRKFPKHSAYRRGLPPIVILLIVLILLLVIWLLWSKFMPKKGIKTIETEMQIADDSTVEKAEDKTDIDLINGVDEQKTPEKAMQTKQYPADPDIASRKPRMLKDGLYILIVKNPT